MSPGRLLFRAAAVVYAVVLMAAVRQQPLEVAGTGSADAVSRGGWTETVVLLGVAGLVVVTFLSAVGALARVLPGTEPAVVEDVYLVGVVTFVLLGAVVLAVARHASQGTVGAGAWPAVLMAVLVTGLLGLALLRARARE